MTAAWDEGYYRVDLKLPVVTGRLGATDTGSKGTGQKRTA
jgi:hypothetical protein